MPRITGLTGSQLRALAYLASGRKLRTGYMGTMGHGIAGSTLAALERRGLVTSHFMATFNVTHYEITDAGRAAVAQLTRSR